MGNWRIEHGRIVRNDRRNNRRAAWLGFDVTGFSQEIMEHAPALLALGRRLTRSSVEAEDLVQDTLVKALRAREQYQAGTNLKAWLFKILKNTFINRYHRGHLERTTLNTSLGDPVVDGWIGSASIAAMRDPESLLLRPELEHHIQSAVERLPEEFRTVVLLADAEGFAYREIAEIVGCPIGTVMSRLHRARRLLKAQLIEHARALGLVEPEAAVEASRPQADVAPSSPHDSSDRPIDLHTYRAAGRRKSS